MRSIEGRNILVTGANRGIGKTIVEKFLGVGAAKIYAAARDPESLFPLLAASGDRVLPVRIDLNRPDTIAAAVEQAKDVDMVVNNAGILRVESPLSNGAIAALRSEMEVNVYGLMRIAQAFAPLLRSSGNGVLVQLNSLASMKNFSDFSTYSASKAAAYSVTQGLRDKLGEQGIFVMSVHPGPIATDMAKSAGLEEIAESAEVVPEAIISALEKRQFHVFPDTMAGQIGEAYASFATNIVEASLME